MTLQHTNRLLTAALASLLLFATAGSTLAQQPPKRLALELDWRKYGSGKKHVAHSFSRRVATHLIPMLEGLGFEVTRVHSAKKAIKSGDHHFALALGIDAKPIWLVHWARQYDRTVVHDSDLGVSAWADYEVYGHQGRKQFGGGKIGPIDSRVHDLPGGGRPEIDDEEAVARLFAGEMADRAGELFRDYSLPEVEEWLEDE